MCMCSFHIFYFLRHVKRSLAAVTAVIVGSRGKDENTELLYDIRCQMFNFA